MRIVLSNSSFKWGGVHVVTDMLATGLTARGHDVLVHCRPGSALHERLRDRFRCETLARGADFSPIAIARIAASLRRFKPGVMLTFMDKDLRLGGVAAHMLGIPVVARRANDNPFSDDLRRRITYRYIATVHVANSNATRATVLKSAPWLPADRVRVIYNGIDTDAVASATPAPLPVPSGALVVGFAGRLEERKGIREILDAWPSVANAVPDAHLVVAGRGPLEAEVTARMAALERAHFLGFRADIANIMNATSVVAVPSYWEGFGLVAVEAMAAGRAVVAAAASSLPELVRDGVEGILVPPRDAGALAAALIRILTDAVLRARMGDAARVRASSAFNYDRMVDEYEQLLAEL